jgi:hypothetical protein
MSEGVRACKQCGEWILFGYPSRMYYPDPLWDEVVKTFPTICSKCEAKNKQEGLDETEKTKGSWIIECDGSCCENCKKRSEDG